MSIAPDLPTTEALQARYPLSQEAPVAISQHRLSVGQSLSTPASHTLGVIGYCSMPDRSQRETISLEGQRLAQVANPKKGRHTAHRMPYWKPRSNPEDWHGEETTDPAGAYETMCEQANLYSHVAAEVGHLKHLGRYARMQTLGWIGGRHVRETDLITAAALFDPTLPLGIKNGLDGSVELALAQVALISRLRQGFGAPAFLIYRGGTNAQDPKLWEYNYLSAMEMTSGKMAVDFAHGGEMAHDPSGEFKKTVVGQIRCMEHVMKLADRGFFPAIIFAEASDLPSPTDPHMPLDVALDGFKSFHSTKSTKVAV